MTEKGCKNYSFLKKVFSDFLEPVKDAGKTRDAKEICAESSLRKNNDQGYGGVPMGNHAELAILS